MTLPPFLYLWCRATRCFESPLSAPCEIGPLRVRLRDIGLSVGLRLPQSFERARLPFVVPRVSDSGRGGCQVPHALEAQGPRTCRPPRAVSVWHPHGRDGMGRPPVQRSTRWPLEDIGGHNLDDEDHDERAEPWIPFHHPRGVRVERNLWVGEPLGLLDCRPCCATEVGLTRPRLKTRSEASSGAWGFGERPGRHPSSEGGGVKSVDLERWHAAAVRSQTPQGPRGQTRRFARASAAHRASPGFLSRALANDWLSEP